MFLQTGKIGRNADASNSDIVYNFSRLDPKRKAVLFDQLFYAGTGQFHNTVRLIWPEVNDQDIKTLEKFLRRQRRKAA